MWQIKRLMTAIGLALVYIASLFVHTPQVVADTASSPSLVVSQLKITSSNGQFITLYNTTDAPLDMSKYQLQYFNNYDLTKTTSSRLISLNGMLPAHGYYMVNDSALLLCYRLTVDSVSLGLSSTAGLIGVLAFNQSTPGSSVVPVLQDYVGWSKTAAAGAQTLPSSTGAFLQRQPIDQNHNPAVTFPGSGSWQTVQPDPNNACSLITASGASLPVQTGLSQLLPGSEPPANIVNLSDDGGASTGVTNPVMPASDIGLMAPQVNEILPNPDGTGNDSTDEYIEIYNPNLTSFDLTGFQLQTGLTSFRTYTFPSGTKLPPHGFTAFYSEATGLTLSNTGSQVKLLDPFGSSLSASGTYSNAKDGQAWALAKGKWYWTTTVTPNLANVIKQPVAAKKAKAATGKSTKSKAKTSAAKTKATKLNTTSGGDDGEATSTPIHTRTLALIGGLALLYGIYEYRTDLANRIRRLRRNIGSGRRDRLSGTGRRDIRASQ